MRRFLLPTAAFFLAVLGLASSAGAVAFPLDTNRRAISASFGEYRSGRLHAGVDLATFGKTGIAVHAVRRGVVYRIRSSANGYGNAIYIRHPGGERSVYAHLEGFAPRLRSLFRRPPHPLGGDNDEKAMEVYPSPEIPVAENEIIGWNGESGSGLPHLHFEWRDAADRPLNPVARGILRVVDRVLPVITAILVEPADPGSSVNGSAFPVNALVDSPVRIKGRARVLLSGYDEDGHLGGRMGFQSVSMIFGGTHWSAIQMDSYTYGRDQETDRLYDPFRTGFGPTVYTLDLTATKTVPEVMSGLGLLPEPRDETFVTIQATDMSGNVNEVFFQILPDRDPARPSSRPGTADYIGPGGIVVQRDGVLHRLTTPGSGRIGDSAWSIRDAERGGTIELAGGGRLIGLSPGQVNRIYSLAGAEGARPSEMSPFEANLSLTPPPQAVEKPLLIGPFGQTFNRNVQISVPRVNGGNGLAQFSNDTWHWISSRIEANRLVASLSFLAPLVVVRDATPPRIKIVKTSSGPVIEITDNFSGVDAESVRVSSRGADGEQMMEGRFDPDRGWFHFNRAPNRRSRLLLVEATDRAGNRTMLEIDPAAERAFR